MRTRIQKWGNSLAVRIPKPYAEEAGLRAAGEVELSVERGELRLVAARKRWRLDELLVGVTKRRLHGEVATGPAVGHEIW